MTIDVTQNTVRFDLMATKTKKRFIYRFYYENKTFVKSDTSLYVSFVVLYIEFYGSDLMTI